MGVSPFVVYEYFKRAESYARFSLNECQRCFVFQLDYRVRHERSGTNDANGELNIFLSFIFLFAQP